MLLLSVLKNSVLILSIQYIYKNKTMSFKSLKNIHTTISVSNLHINY